MNDPTLLGPCADYEHDIVDLHENGLGPERARLVALHLVQCARCRSWAAELAALDARLADRLPRPAPSPDFDLRLRERIATLAAAGARGDVRTRLEREHDSLLEALRVVARRRALLGATGAGALALAAMAAARTLLVQGTGWLPGLAESPERWMVFGGVGAALAVATLAWTAARNGPGVLPGLR
jgi:hypothetical protein